jgi:dTDP-4-dehydrorhamnose 3,5-epimerase
VIGRALPHTGARALRHVPFEDERGSFSRVMCTDALDQAFAQASVSRNPHRGTLRGLHTQAGEAKLVTCLSGRVWDVIVDLETRRWDSVRLGEGGYDAVLIPAGCAHGFLTLTDDVTLLYHCSTAYDAGRSSGIRWDDPTLAIAWPEPPQLVSARDRALPVLP